MTANVPGSADDRRPISIVLVDDQSLLREGLRTLLELHPDLHIVGEAGDGIVAETLVERHQPDVVLMDLRMPHRDGVEATRRIVKRWPSVHVLVLTTFDEDQLVSRSIEAGAAGYLLKDVGSDALADAVRAASRGESPLQPSRAGGGSVLTSAPPSGGEPLTQRELDVLRLLGKTGLHDRTQSAVRAVRRGFT